MLSNHGAWAVRRSHQSILKEISPEYSLEGQMLKLKLQYIGHLIQRTNSLEKTLRLGKIEGRRRRIWQRTRWLVGITDSMDLSLSGDGRWWRTGKPGMLQSMGLQRAGHDWVTEQQHWDCVTKHFILPIICQSLQQPDESQWAIHSSNQHFRA